MWTTAAIFSLSARTKSLAKSKSATKVKLLHKNATLQLYTVLDLVLKKLFLVCIVRPAYSATQAKLLDSSCAIRRPEHLGEIAAAIPRPGKAMSNKLPTLDPPVQCHHQSRRVNRRNIVKTNQHM